MALHLGLAVIPAIIFGVGLLFLPESPRWLAGDIGGTKTDLGISTLAHSPRAPIASGRLPGDRYNRREELVDAFLISTTYALTMPASISPGR